jgi:hypothetical protein
MKHLHRLLPVSVGLASVMLSCSSQPVALTCGEGTAEVAGECVPTDDGGQDTTPAQDDTAQDDTAADDTATDDTATDDTAVADTGDDGTVDNAVDVYLLAGQSNMVGFGQTVSLEPRLRVAQDDVWLYWSGQPVWQGLQPASAYTSTSHRYFGPEVPMGRALADAHPDRAIYLIKHAVGGTALHDFWYPGETTNDPSAGEGYTVWWDTVEAGLAALTADGQEPVVRGMVWMQGESDAISAETAAAYATNLEHLIARVRADTGVADLPFVTAQIDCRGLCDHRDVVNAAMVSVAGTDPAVHTFGTEDCGRYPTDGWHYQGPGVRAIGERFAARLLEEELPPFPAPAVTITGTYTWSYTGNYTVGWRFTLSQDVLVTDLGQFDLGLDGLTHATTVAIWDADTGGLRVEGEVPAAETQSAPSIGNFRYAGVAPTRLEAGDYIIGLQSFLDNPDYYVYDAQITPAGPVTWVEGRHLWSTVLTIPTTVVAGTTNVATWFGPNFRWTPVP